MKPVVGLDVSALDEGFKAHAARGIGRYVKELHRYMVSHQSDIAGVETFDHQTVRLPRMMERAVEMIPVGRQTIRQQLVYPFRLGTGAMSRFSALHFPAHMDAPAWLGKPYLLTVLDIIPVVLANLYAAEVPGWRFRFARYLELRAIKSAALILAISQHTANDLERVLGIPPERIRVTPLGVDEGFFAPVDDAVKEKAWELIGIPRASDMLLYVGGIDPRKNVAALLTVLEELSQVRQQGGDPLPHLVIAGRIEGDRGYPALCQTIRGRGLSPQVHLLGYVTDEMLKALYQIASVFVFPSLYEGFGLPPLEAMAAGLPVVSSDTSSMPEVLGDVGIGVPPNDTKRWVDELRLLLDDKERRLSISRAGIEQARRFTWSRTGEATLSAYEQFCAERWR